MPPAPARRLTRRAAASLPASARAAFLLDAARDPALLAAAPGLAAHLASAACKVAAAARLPLARGSATHLCPACGCVLGRGDYGSATVVPLPSRSRRRARVRALKRASGGGGAAGGPPAAAPPPINTAALVIPCSACGEKGVRPFYTADAAAAALARLQAGGGGGEGGKQGAAQQQQQQKQGVN